MRYCYHLLCFEILCKYWVNLGHGYPPYQPVQNSIHQQHQTMICVSSHIPSMDEHGIYGASPSPFSSVWISNESTIFACVSEHFMFIISPQNFSDIPHIHQHAQTLKRYQITSTFHAPVLATKGWVLSCQCKQPKSCQCNDSTSKAKTLGWERFRPRKTLEFSWIWIRHSNRFLSVMV